MVLHSESPPYRLVLLTSGLCYLSSSVVNDPPNRPLRSQMNYLKIKCASKQSNTVRGSVRISDGGGD